MCTLSFIPTADGYLAGMNRDERLTRPAARPPEMFERAEMSVIRPSEPAGGTWIAFNNRGTLLAVLNWNHLHLHGRRMPEKAQTRGVVIPQLIWQPDSSAVHSCFSQMPLTGMLPFRLVGIFRDEAALIAWHWDGIRTARTDLPWMRQHWFSSSLSDALAAKQRGAACEKATHFPGVGTRDWLRSLHATHVPSPGAFSICVHRHDAATVSYTEVCCRRDRVVMDYFPGHPCGQPALAKTIEWLSAPPAQRKIETFSCDGTLTSRV